MKNLEEYFDEKAAGWDTRHYTQEKKQEISELIRSFKIKQGDKVLDVGTGNGILIPYILEDVGIDGALQAFDLSQQMVAEAKRKYAAENLEIFQADVHQLALADDEFDKVICFAAFPHFTDTKTALKEMARVLKHKGQIYIAHLMSKEELNAHHAMHKMVAQHCLPGDDKIEALFLECSFLAPSITNKPGLYLATAQKR